MSKAIDRRIRALEALRPPQPDRADQPRWFIEAQNDPQVWGLLRSAAVEDDAVSLATLHDRFGMEADQMVAAYGDVWRQLDAEC